MAEQAVKELFTEINRAEPVLLVDLPDTDGGASADENAMLTDAAELLAQRYPAMFKPSHSCRPPHLNVDVLRAEMHRAELISRHGLATSEQLLEWVEGANAELGARAEAEWHASADGTRAKSSSAMSNALAKANEHQFWLGLGYEWLQK